MSLDRSAGPRSEVFTTALWDGEFALADWHLHLARLTEHAKLLRIELPENMPQQLETLLQQERSLKKTTQSHEPKLLVKIKCTQDGELSVDSRSIDFRNEEVDAITVEAPRWSSKVNGTKHGDWQAYIDARHDAEKKGVDVALLQNAAYWFDSQWPMSAALRFPPRLSCAPLCPVRRRQGNCRE